MDFKEKDLWLTCQWDFIPSQWGCIGFTKRTDWEHFFENTTAGTIVAIYIANTQKAPKEKRGKVVGFIELSGETGDSQDFIAPALWEKNQRDEKAKGKWIYGSRIRRAWNVKKDNWKKVEDVFKKTYDSDSGQTIGSRGKVVEAEDFIHVENLEVEPAEVYRQDAPPTESKIISAKHAFAKPSRAGPINSGGYFLEKYEGKKHLYILKLKGLPSNWLGENSSLDYKNKIIIKFGFSKSPRVRCKTIQSNYPLGQFEWEVMFPRQFNNPPADDGATALIGEKAMKEFLENHPDADSLEGEFFLVPKSLCKKCFDAGLNAINGLA